MKLKSKRKLANKFHLDECTPFYLCLTNKEIIKWVAKTSPKMLFLDLTGGTNMYG